MCLKPNLIPNPNYKGIRHNKGDPRYYKDYLNQYLEVPCGHCKECITQKQMSYVQRIMEESRDNEFFMLTLTYKEDMIPKLKVGKYTFRYADTNDFSLMCKRMDTWRNRGSKKHKYVPYPFRYFAVTELGERKKRPHIHALILIKKKYLPDRVACLNAEKKIYWAFREEWCRCIKVPTGRKNRKGQEEYRNEYLPLFEYHETFQNKQWKRNYDLHYVYKEATENGVEDCCWYVLKYMLKDADAERKRQQALKLNLKEWEYEKAWETIKTKRFYSTLFGLDAEYEKSPFGNYKYNEDIVKHIKECIRKSKGAYPYPCWINPWNGKYFPLCKFYKEKIMTLEDIDYFFDEKYILEGTERQERNQALAKQAQFEKIRKAHEYSAVPNF